MSARTDTSNVCGATLLLGDDYGDNECTIRCSLNPGHEGPHQERFERDGTPVLIEYHVDERREVRDSEDLDDGC